MTGEDLPPGFIPASLPGGYPGAMSARRALLIVLALSLVGIVFSGTLTYRELCSERAGGCTAAPVGTLLGLPVCVYGLVMYLLVALVAGSALWSGRASHESPRDPAAGQPAPSA
jgi:hypothetical protein